jgi:DNA-binding transcriptional MerR regulator
MAEFHDGKDQGALRTIGEVSEALGIKTHVLRYWEEQFPQLRPLKRAGGRRLYRPGDIALIEQIDSLVNRQGFTLKGARGALKVGSGEIDPASSPPAEVRENADDLLTRLRSIRKDLADALGA